MNPRDLWCQTARRTGLLIATNLLLLFVVGSVNRDRIEQFKRTRQYTKRDYNLLRRLIEAIPRLCTVPHVMAEVSNLTDLTGAELSRARLLLKNAIAVMQEPVMPSLRATERPLYERFGPVDAALAAVAREVNCAVLTNDLDLYVSLDREGIPVYNFTHLRAVDMCV